jgi:CheY-like chemotaxis protein
MTQFWARDRRLQSADSISSEAVNVDVLVIEAMVRRVQVKNLSRSSAISVVVQNSGLEALAWLASRGVVPKVILLSVRLTDMEGLEVLGEIRANLRTATTPVIVIADFDQKTLQTAAVNSASMDSGSRKTRPC